MARPSRAFLVPSVLGVLALCGCAGAQNIHAVKADDYTKTPQRLLIALPVETTLADAFKTSLATALAKCGMTVQFTRTYNPADAKIGHFDAILRSNALGQETTTVTYRSGAQYSYVDMLRYEFALIDTGTQKNVWKEQIDFTKPSRGSDTGNQEIWATALFDSMVKNKLVGSCESGREVPVATPLAYVSTLPAVPQTANASRAPGKPAALSFKVGATSYTTADAALDALRAQSDANIAQITQIAPRMYEPMLIVVPSQEEIERTSIKITGLANEADFKKYMIGIREIQYETYAKAFRKNALFREVTSVRSDQVKPGDFMGSRYKLWFAAPEGKGQGFWVLASSKGGEERFQITDNSEKNQISGMLTTIKNVLEKLPQ